MYLWTCLILDYKERNHPVTGLSEITLGHHTDRGPMGLGQYNSLRECCGLSTASEVFLILVAPPPLYLPSGFDDIMQGTSSLFSE